MFRNLAIGAGFVMRSNLTGNSLQQLNKSLKRCLATKKRFYRKPNVLYNDGKYELTLDQRKLKTPKGSLFQVDSEPLALAIAAEWDAQKEIIQQSTMHLTGLSSTVIDNPSNLTKYDIVKAIIDYLDTDTILFISPEQDELYDLQMKQWIPVLEWFCKRFGVDIKAARDISGPKITQETRDILSRHLLSHNFWSIHGYIFAIEALKSVTLGLTCAERHITVEQAVLLARLEEEYQANKWGRVEWAHDLNQQDLQARVAAGIFFIHTNSTSTTIKNKAAL